MMIFSIHKEKEEQALILGSRTVNGGPIIFLVISLNRTCFTKETSEELYEKRLKVKECFTNI